MCSFNVDKFRENDENPSRWNLRRRFLQAFSTRFPEEKLIYLSKCFVNVELDGSKYPDPVMKQIAELRTDLPETDEEQTDNKKRKHTESQEAGSASMDKKNTGSGDSHATSSHSATDDNPEQQTIKKMKSEKDNEENATQDSDKPKSDELSAKKEPFELREKSYYKNASIDEKFEALSEVVKSLHTPTCNAMEVIYEAVPRVKLSVQYETYRATSENYFESVVRIKYVEVGRVRDSKKRMAELNAFVEAKKQLMMKYHRIVSVDLDEEMEKQFLELGKTVEELQNPQKTVFDIMYRAIRLVKPRMAIQVDIHVDNRTHSFECVVSVNCIEISRAQGENKVAAKNTAFTAAKDKLIMIYNNEISIKVLKLESSDQPFPI